MSHLALRSIGITMMTLATIVGFSFLSIYFGWLNPARNEIGVHPQINLHSDEKLMPVIKIGYRGVEYGTWDMRNKNTNALKSMLVVNPSDGTIITNRQQVAKVSAIRLTLQMANTVKTINEQVSRAEQIAQKIGGMIDAAAHIAEAAGQKESSRELRKLSICMSEKTEMVFILANIIQSSEQPAEALLKDPNESTADRFLTSLSVSAAMSCSQRAAFVCFLAITALQDIGLHPSNWIDEAYLKLTLDSQPSLEVLAQTFGVYQANITDNLVAERM